MHDLKFMIDLLLVAIVLLIAIGVTVVLMFKNLNKRFYIAYEHMNELQNSFDTLHAEHSILVAHHSASCSATKQAFDSMEKVARDRSLVMTGKIGNATVRHSDLMQLAADIASAKRTLETF